MIPNRYEIPSIENVPVWEKFKNNTVDKEKILFLLVYIKICSLATPGLLSVPVSAVEWKNRIKLHKKLNKTKEKPPEKKTVFKKFLLYCEELESKFPFIEDCFSKWIEKLPTAGFKNDKVLEFVEWNEKSIYKKGWHSSLQERLYIGMNLYLLKKGNVTD